MPFFQMSKLVLKWAFKKPATCRYPFAPRQPLPQSRGQLEFTKESCIYCVLCQKKCPTSAITVDRTGKTWAIDRLRCINCGACVDACPKDSLDLSTAHTTAVTNATPGVKP